MALLNFKRNHEAIETDLARAIAAATAETAAEAEAQQPPRSLLDTNIGNVSRVLSRFEADAALLEDEITSLQHRLVQTRISIAAFSSALNILEGGKS